MYQISKVTHYYNLIFNFRFILNIILAYEFFQKGVEVVAQEILVCVGKWLEEFDKSNDKFYLQMKDGLKHVLTTTLIYMKPWPLISLKIQQVIIFNIFKLVTVYLELSLPLFHYSSSIAVFAVFYFPLHYFVQICFHSVFSSLFEVTSKPFS